MMLDREVRLPHEIVFDKTNLQAGKGVAINGDYVFDLKGKMQTAHYVARLHI